MIKLKYSAITICSFLLAACSDDKAGNQQQAIPKVSVLKIEEQMINPSRDYVGTTEAKEDINIQARVDGYLIKQTFRDGQAVNKGDILFEIDPATYEAKHNSAKAKVAQDQAAVDVAVLNFKRGKNLITKGAISQSHMDELKSKKLQAEAALEVSKADLKTAELNLNYTKVTAPTNGVMSKANVSLGDLINPSTTLASLVQNDPMYVSFQISERQLLEYREAKARHEQEGKEAPKLYPELKLATGSIYPQKGTFESLDNRVDITTGTIEIRAAFPNPNGFLLPGQHVTVVVVSEQSQPQLVVPQKSIQEDQSGKYVLVINAENNVVKQNIKVGQKSGTDWVVQEGLASGVSVIVDGLQKVRVGGKAEAISAVQPDIKNNDTPLIPKTDG